MSELGMCDRDTKVYAVPVEYWRPSPEKMRVCPMCQRECYASEFEGESGVCWDCDDLQSMVDRGRIPDLLRDILMGCALVCTTLTTFWVLLS